MVKAFPNEQRSVSSSINVMKIIYTQGNDGCLGELAESSFSCITHRENVDRIL